MKDIYNLTFIHLGNKNISNMTYKQNYSLLLTLNKPDGFWGSKFKVNSEYKSSWHKFISYNSYLNKSSEEVLFKVKENTPILIIDDIVNVDAKYINLDLLKEKEELEAKLLEKKPSDSDFFLILSEYQKTSLYLSKKLINWKNILNDFKGVYLTEEALSSRFSFIFKTWDVESIVIFDTSVLEEVCNV